MIEFIFALKTWFVDNWQSRFYLTDSEVDDLVSTWNGARIVYSFSGFLPEVRRRMFAAFKSDPSNSHLNDVGINQLVDAAVTQLQTDAQNDTDLEKLTADAAAYRIRDGVESFAWNANRKDADLTHYVKNGLLAIAGELDLVYGDGSTVTTIRDGITAEKQTYA